MTKLAIYVDGGVITNPGRAASAAVVVDEHGQIVVERTKILENATSNIAEYTALAVGAGLARFCGATHASFFTDSQLVANQISKWWAIRDPELGKLHAYVTSELMALPLWQIQWITRERNAYADRLCNIALRPHDRRALRVAQVPKYTTADFFRQGFPAMEPVKPNKHTFAQSYD